MAERYIPEHRRTQFKARNQFRPDELRRRREEQQVEIRRQKREENLAKRRGIQTSEGAVGVGAAAGESDDEASVIESEVRSYRIVLSSGSRRGSRSKGHTEKKKKRKIRKKKEFFFFFFFFGVFFFPSTASSCWMGKLLTHPIEDRLQI